MRLFNLVRLEDVSGVSGTGLVAEGCLFGSGKVVMTWLGQHHTFEIFDYIDEVIEIHGHGGKTVIEWMDNNG